MKTPKRTYMPPQMDVSEVELESTICSGSVFNTQDQNINIQAQEFNNSWDKSSTDGGADFTGSSWDDLSK